MRPFVKLRPLCTGSGNFFAQSPSKGHTEKIRSAEALLSRLCKGEHIMDDLRYNPSALLLVGLLIAVIDVLL